MDPRSSGGNPNPSDAESIMASALLRFRSDSSSGNREEHFPVGVAPTAAEAASRLLNDRSFVGPRANSSLPIIPMQSPQVPLVSGLHGVGPSLNRSQQAFSRQQLASLQAAAAAGAASFVAATSNPSPLVSALSPVRAANASSLLDQVTTPSSMQVSALLGQAASSNSTPEITARLSSHTASDDNRDEDERKPPPEVAIRKEEVEAALRSKPQRGRKRANLSEMERQELTRTRNREHAKSTRIRKKVRYEELLDRERQLLDLQSREKLFQERRKNVLDFIAVREGMLQCVRSSDTSTKSDETAVAGNTEINGSEKVEIQDVVGNVNTFSFGDMSDPSGEESASSCMKTFDETLVARAVSRFGESVIRLLSYKIKGSRDGVALNLFDTGFAEVELVVSGHNEIHLVSYVLQVKFLSESHKLSSVVWMTVSDEMDNQSLERLDAQISHPSVVSLDHEKQVDAAEEVGQGPGMTI